MPGPMKIPSLRERTEELQQKAAAQKEVKDEAIKAARKRIEAEEKQNTFDNFLASEDSEIRTPTKRGRGRPKKDKLAYGVEDEDPNITGLRALIKALKPFRGSKKEGLNGINLTYMIARDGTDKPSPIIYATNKHVGAFAYANFDLDLATLSTETVTGSISPDLAAELLIPPPAEMLVPVQFDTARSRLVKGEKGWEVELRDGPNLYRLRYEDFTTWLEGRNPEVVDCYKPLDRLILFRETPVGWAAITYKNEEAGASADGD